MAAAAGRSACMPSSIRLRPPRDVAKAAVIAAAAIASASTLPSADGADSTPWNISRAAEAEASSASSLPPGRRPAASRMAPAVSRSSSVTSPSVPAQTRWIMDVPCATASSRARAATAARFTMAPMSTSEAAVQASSAAVPLVVVITIRRPATRAREYSSGELPRSKPSIRRPPRSPPRSTPESEPALKPAARARATSTVSTGRTPVAPWARAVMIVVEARNTSITTAIPPATAPGGIR